MFDLVHKVTFYQIICMSTYLTDFTLEEQVSDWQHPFIYMVTHLCLVVQLCLPFVMLYIYKIMFLKYVSSPTHTNHYIKDCIRSVPLDIG